MGQKEHKRESGIVDSALHRMSSCVTAFRTTRAFKYQIVYGLVHLSTFCGATDGSDTPGGHRISTSRHTWLTLTFRIPIELNNEMLAELSNPILTRKHCASNGSGDDDDSVQDGSCREGLEVEEA